MIITKIVIQNYRSLKDITIDDLKQFNVFIGKNGSGKSHILEALELFFTDLNLFQQTEKGFEENLWFDRENTVPIQFKIQLKLTEKQIDEIFSKDILKAMTIDDRYKLKVNELTIEREISGNRWNNKSISLGDWELVKDNTILKDFPVSVYLLPEAEAMLLEQQPRSFPLPPEPAQKILNKMTELIKGKFKLIRTNRESGERPSPGIRPFLIDSDTRNYLTAIGQNPAEQSQESGLSIKNLFKVFHRIC